jgi:CBS domain-containing protein
MKAKEIMVRDVVAVSPTTPVREAARMMVDHRVSGLPVVDADGRVVGIVSEGDLIHRAETGTERRRSWWLEALAGAEELARDYVLSHARKVGDVMTRRVISAAEESELGQIAALMERHRVKRVPIVRDGRLVGIVSRADLVKAYLQVATRPAQALTDADIRSRLDAVLAHEPWVDTALLNVSVDEGVVELGGCVSSDEQRKALQVAAEALPGVRTVHNHVVVRMASYGY